MTSRFIAAAIREKVDVTPVWLMRQAGRSLPEYRKLRERWTLADIVAQPELCAEVTLQPVRRLGVDAAVMFADIMLPLRGMGVEFELVENVGPVIENPIASAADVERLRVPDGRRRRRRSSRQCGRWLPSRLCRSSALRVHRSPSPAI